MSRPVTCWAATVKGFWHWLWQKFSWAAVATVTCKTPGETCLGVIWSNQTRCRLGCWCRTMPRILCQAVGSNEAERASCARRRDASRGEGEWVVSMASFSCTSTFTFTFTCTGLRVRVYAHEPDQFKIANKQTYIE